MSLARRWSALAAVLALSACASSPPDPTAPIETAPAPTVSAPSSVSPSEPGYSQPVRDPIYPDHGNPSLDVIRYDLDLAWSPEKRELTGRATLSIRVAAAVTEVSLDFIETYTVDTVTIDGRAARSSFRGDHLVVPAALVREARITLVVRYHGTPHALRWPSNRSDAAGGIGLRPTDDGGAWTMQEPYGASTWYPANDQPSDEALYDVAATVPAGWTAVAHGALVSADPGPNGVTYRWRASDPVATYLATLAIGRYTKVTDTGPHGLPITYWIRTGRDEAFLPVLKQTPRLITWLESRFGRYPFPSIGVVTVDSDSAMETQQMVTLGVNYGRRGDAPPDVRVFTEVVLHELAHQWFGDSVTPTDWRGLWINEGWAMYAQWMWTVDAGYDDDESWVLRAREGDAHSRPVAGPPGDPKPDHFGERTVYYGPALMLREIRQAVGDRAFFRLATDWVATHRNQQVNRDTFVAFVNAATGRNFTALIASWLDSPTTPSA